MSRFYDMTNCEPPTYDSSPAAISRFWEDFHSASPTEKENFVRRHPGIKIPAPIDPNAYVDTSLLTFTPDDHRYQDRTPNAAADIAAREAATKLKLDAASAELQRRLAIAQAKIDALQEVARDLFYEYHRVKEKPEPTHHTNARTCAEIKECYLAARGFDPRSTVELDRYNTPTFRLNGFTREAWARATDELDTNAQARHAAYVAEAKARYAAA